MNNDTKDVETPNVKLKCFECGEDIDSGDETKADDNETYCSECYDEKFFICADCDEETLQCNRNYNIYDDRICESCRVNYWVCNYCDTMYPCDEQDYCECQDEKENIESLLRDYNTDDTYVGNKTERTYSCEVECYYPDFDAMENVANEISNAIGITEDGSLENHGIEFNTPKLSGLKGEKLLKEFCQTLNDNKFKVDSSCGLHVHLGGDDLLVKRGAIQKLMLFFMVYEDVIMSFLPQSRRANRFCYPLSEFYHLREIKNCYCVDDFEQIWYRDDNKERIDERKKDRHDQSRYCGINFHSLLANGHIEIRYHSGTINYNKIINWIKLFVQILDKSKENYTIFNIDNINKAKFILGLPEKTSSFFKMIDLPQEQRDYFIARQKNFAGNNEESETSCAE